MTDTLLICVNPIDGIVANVLTPAEAAQARRSHTIYVRESLPNSTLLIGKVFTDAMLDMMRAEQEKTPAEEETTWVFWRYDGYPHFLSGPLDRELEQGRVYVKGYSNHRFIPFLRLKGPAGKRLHEIRKLLQHLHNVERKKLNTNLREAALRVLPYPCRKACFHNDMPNFLADLSEFREVLDAIGAIGTGGEDDPLH